MQTEIHAISTRLEQISALQKHIGAYSKTKDVYAQYRRAKDNPKFARNKNIMVVGGSGSGKTRFFLKPNLMQMHSSYVITDPNGITLP